jgi:hypothetical protein
MKGDESMNRMYRRKVMLAAAVFGFGVAIAARPTSLRADWEDRALPESTPWVPGTSEPMSAFEPGLSVAPPH